MPQVILFSIITSRDCKASVNEDFSNKQVQEQPNPCVFLEYNPKYKHMLKCFLKNQCMILYPWNTNIFMPYFPVALVNAETMLKETVKNQ